MKPIIDKNISRMYKEPEKLIKSPMDMGKFQRSEGYRKGLLLYHS